MNKEIKENNKLIANFLGWELVYENTYKNLEGNFFRVDSLGFHDSWDWLMKAVEKIESLNIEIHGVVTSFDVTIVYGDCNIQDEDGIFVEFVQYSTDSQSKIQATYKAVIEFIKWYNNG